MSGQESQDAASGGKSSGSFTLAEAIVMALAVVALAGLLYAFFRHRDTGRRGSECIAGVGSIRTAFRVYAAGHNGTYPVLTNVDGTGLSVLGITAGDLNWRYVKARNYRVTSTVNTYTIRVTLPGGGPNDFYEINQDGVENAGGYTTGNSTIPAQGPAATNVE